MSIVAEAEIGKIYTGKVVRIVDFGAFVNFLGAKDGLVHISEMADYRVGKVTDIVKEGDMVKVKVVDIERGKVRLSMKVVNQETGEDISAQLESKRRNKDETSAA
jgi:polyribonucleotide nucleotidyltransferase